MLDTLSVAQLAKVFNAVTDRKPVRKFESHARALALTMAELVRMHVTAPVALARAGLPVPDPKAAQKFLSKSPRLGPKPGRETLKRSERQFVPTATDAVTGAPVELRSLHGPIRTVEGDPEKAARKVATAAVVELRPARKAREAARKVAPVPAAPAVKAPAPVKTDGLTAEQSALLMALIDCKALADKPRAARAGKWVKYKAIHESATPHNLAKGQLPGLTGALRRRGLIELPDLGAVTVGQAWMHLTVPLGLRPVVPVTFESPTARQLQCRNRRSPAPSC